MSNPPADAAADGVGAPRPDLRRRSARPAPVAVGHRGAPRQARENTLASLRAAVAAGADWVELDVRLTRSGEPVLLHDATLDRLWQDSRPVAQLDLADLAALHRSASAPGTATAAAEARGPADPLAATAEPDADARRIPTLAEAVELLRATGTPVMADQPGPAEARAALAVLRAAEYLPHTVFAGDLAGLRAVRSAAPEARIALTWKRPVPPPRALLAELRPEYLNLRHLWATRPLIRWAHRRGLLVSAWTVDRPGRMDALLRAGVDALISNEAAVLVRRVAAHRPR